MAVPLSDRTGEKPMMSARGMPLFYNEEKVLNTLAYLPVHFEAWE